MIDKIEVTQSDREAAWHYADFGHLHDRQERERWFAGYYDNQPVGYPIHAFARHAHAARLEGARAALEAAAKGAKYPVVLPAWAQRSGLSLQDYISAWEDGHLDHNEAIRTLDPEQIVKGMAIV